MLKVTELITKGRQYSARGRVQPSIIYIWPKGETLLENLQNRRSRPIKEWRKEVIPQVLAQAGLPANTKVSFRQKAGCPCGCSPGWILDAPWGKAYHATIEEVDS